MCLLQAAHKPSSNVLQKLYFTAFHKQLFVTTAKEVVCIVILLYKPCITNGHNIKKKA